MNTIKKSLLSLAVASVVATPLMANAEGFGTISANVGLTTDYYFRGISQTDNDGAIQGGFDWSHDSGFYAGVWGSNVDFGDTHIEIDTYVGFANEFGDTGIGYDVNFNRFNYNDADFETNELTFGLSYSYFSASYSYSDDWYDSDESSSYVNLGFAYDELPMGLALSASVGKSFGDAFDKDKVGSSEDFDYVDYKIALSKQFYGLDWELAYVDNDLDRGECTSYAYDYDKGHCDGRFILTVSKGIDDVSKSSEGSDLPITANVALVTDYYFRGISQTDNDGAIQGGFDYAHDSGFYAGVWGSNVDFGDTHIEIDTYVGFANEFGDTGIGYDVNFNRFNYNDADFETNELTFGLSYSYFSASYSYSDDWYDSDESSSYVNLGFAYDELPMGLALSASVGKSFGDAFDKDEVGTMDDFDYVDYKVGVSKDIAGVTFDLSYVGNDMDREECEAYAYDYDKGHCDDRFILTVSKGF